MQNHTTDSLLSVCENIAAGDTVAQACKAAGVGERTFFRALAEDGEGNIGQCYARARRFRADKRAAEIEDLARRACLPKDNPEHLDPNAARVAIDSLKWLAARENNSRFGDRLAVEVPDTKPAPTREEHLAQLKAAGLSVADIFGTLTKPAEPIAALPASDASSSTPGEVLDVDV